MKQFFFAWFITALAIGMSSCSKESLTISAEELFKLDGNVNVFCAGFKNGTAADLPTAAKDYIKTNFDSTYKVHHVRIFSQDSAKYYGVELKKVGESKKLLFNAKGELISKGDSNERSEYYLLDKIPEAIKTYLAEKFPNISIKEVELKHEYGLSSFKIELSNDVKLTFSANGTIWCQGSSKSSDDDDDDDDDNDDDDDDDNGNDDGDDDDDDNGNDDDDDDDDNGNDDDDDDDDNGDDDDGDSNGSGNSGGTDDNNNSGSTGSGSGSTGSGNSGGTDDNSNNTSTTPVNVSTTIKAFVASKYPGFVIYESGKEDWCDNLNLIKVGIKKGSEELHLVFDLSEKFVFEARRIAESKLPAAVSNSIKSLYPGYQIKDAKDIEELSYPDGTKRYYVRLRKSGGGGGSDVRVMFTADGKVFCQKK